MFIEKEGDVLGFYNDEFGVRKKIGRDYLTRKIDEEKKKVQKVEIQKVGKF